MEIQLAKINDFQKFLPIKEEFLKDYGISKKSKEFIFEEFKKHIKNGTIILATEKEKIIGYLTGEIEKNIYEKTGYIGEIFVIEKFRGKGISTKLKDEFLNFLKEKKVAICRIDVNPNNPAQEIYKKWGFKIDKYRMSLKI